MNKPDVMLIGREASNDTMTTEAHYRMLRVLRPLASKLYFLPINFKPETNRIIGNVNILQSSNLIQTVKALLSKRVDCYMFWYGGEILQMALPCLLLRIFRPKARIVLRIDGRSSIIHLNRGSPLMIYGLHSDIEWLLYRAVTVIAYQYEGMIEDYQMQKYANKMKLATQFIDTDLFQESVLFQDRQYDIGFVGRFDDNKGVMKLVMALNIVKFRRVSFKAIFIGDGVMYDAVIDWADYNKLNAVIPGRLSIEETAKKMSDIKYLVIPSNVEGLPKVAIEAMASGVIPISSKAGGLKYLIKEGSTGYVMKSNSPEHIAEAIIRALDSQAYANNIIAGYQDIVDYYSYENTVERYREIINGV